MNKNIFTWAIAAALCAQGGLTSCSDDENNNGGDGSNIPGISRYVIAAATESGDGGTYLVTSESLDEGSVTIINNGTETDDAAYWVSLLSDKTRQTQKSIARAS